MKNSKIITVFIIVLLLQFYFVCTVISDGSTIEDFETGSGWPWSPWQGGTGTVSSSYAHDGSYGIMDPGWCYRTDVSLGNTDETLSAWVRFESDGRFYLGFAADSEGCWSFVVAPNTNNIIIQQNSGYGYSNKATTTYSSFTTNVWYKAVVEFASTSSVTGKLYSSDGNTLLAQVSYNSVTGLPGGVSIRAFGTTHIDTIESNAGSSNSAPTANFTFLTPATVNEEISFDASTSTDSDGTITNYSWDWTNDGSYDDYGETQTHTYTEIGTYNITLRVQDDEGQTDSQTQEITILSGPSPPVPETSTLLLVGLGFVLIVLIMIKKKKK